MINSTRDSGSDTASEEDEIIDRGGKKVSVIDGHASKSSEMSLEGETTRENRYLNYP
jgi:hypothetical protein